MAESPLPALLFDLDGTLIDSIELLLGSARHAFSGRERAPTDAEWTAGIGTPLIAQLRQFVTTEEEVAELVAAYRTYQNENHDRLTRCFDDVVPTIEQLSAAGHPMGIVTSKSDAIARRSLSYVGLDRYFPVVVGVDSTTRHKPDPEPVLLAIDRLGVRPAEAVFVGDSPHDVRAGNAAGVVTVAALWGPFSREALEPAGPSHYLRCLAELPALLERIFPTVSS